MRARKIALFLLLFLAIPAGVLVAQVTIINSDQLHAWIKGSKKFVLVDSRTEDEYQQGHIPGAVNIPPGTIKEESGRKRLTGKKNSPIIFYCRGEGWGLSRMAADAATEMGYTNLMIYQPGMPDWTAKGNPVQKGAQPGRLK